MPGTARTIDFAVGERHQGPILRRPDGQRLDRRTAHRWCVPSEGLPASVPSIRTLGGNNPASFWRAVGVAVIEGGWTPIAEYLPARARARRGVCVDVCARFLTRQRRLHSWWAQRGLETAGRRQRQPSCRKSWDPGRGGRTDPEDKWNLVGATVDQSLAWRSRPSGNTPDRDDGCLGPPPTQNIPFGIHARGVDGH